MGTTLNASASALVAAERQARADFARRADSCPTTYGVPATWDQLSQSFRVQRISQHLTDREMESLAVFGCALAAERGANIMSTEDLTWAHDKLAAEVARRKSESQLAACDRLNAHLYTTPTTED